MTTPEKKRIGEVDMTPTWEAVLPIYVEAATVGLTSDGRKSAWAELRRMAGYADKYVAAIKAGQLKPE